MSREGELRGLSRLEEEKAKKVTKIIIKNVNPYFTTEDLGSLSQRVLFFFEVEAGGYCEDGDP